MATRGIFKIGNVTLYNHWDNYPMGAAFHLCNALKEQHELSLFSLIRGLKNSDLHSFNYSVELDTWGAEYFYEITDNHFINVYEISETDQKKLVSTKPVIDFINEQVRLYFALKYNDANEMINDFLLVNINDHYYSVNQAIDDFNKTYKKAVDFFNKKFWGNSSSSFSDAFKLAKKSGIDVYLYKSEYLNNYAPKFVEVYKHSNSDYFNSYVN